MKMLYISGLFVGTIALQAIAIYFMPLTKGATALLPTIGMVVCFVIFSILLARLMAAGMNLSILTPLMAAIGPLTGIAIGTLIYGEVASLAKMATLLAGCGLIVLASLM